MTLPARPEPAARTPDRTPRRAGVATLAAFFTHGVLVASWAAHIPEVKDRLDIGDAVLGTALLGQPIGSITATVVAGVLVPRLGSRRLVQVSVAGYCLSGAVIGMVGSAAALFAALFVWGAFMGLLDISMNAQAIAVEEAEARPLMNGMHAGWSVGAFTGAGIGALLVGLGVRLTAQMVGLGAVALLVAGALSRWMISDARHRSGHRPPRLAGRRVPRAIMLLGLVAFASMLVEGAAADWSSVYVHDSLGGGAAEGGLAYAGFTLSMLAVRLLGNRLLLHFRPTALLPALAAVATVAFAVALAADTVAAGLLGFFVLGAGVGAVVPTTFSAAGRVPGIHAGVAVAVVSGIGWAGFVLAPPLIGHLSSGVGLGPALIVLPLLTGFIAAAIRWAPALRRAYSPSSG